MQQAAAQVSSAHPRSLRAASADITAPGRMMATSPLYTRLAVSYLGLC